MPKLNLIKQVQDRTGTTDTTATALNIKYIPIGEISAQQNVRDSDNIEIADIKSSIKIAGLIQPITVYKNKHGDGYICKSGHRRLRAYKELYIEDKDKFHSILCIIGDGENITIIQLIENLQRNDLKPIELYKALKELKSQGLTIKQISDAIGKSEGYIKKLYAAVNVIKRTPEIKETMKSYAGVTLDDIQETSGISDPERKKLLKKKGKKTITRQQLRDEIKTLKNKNCQNPSQSVELNIHDNELLMEIKFDDKDTLRLVSTKLKLILKQHNIKIKGQ